MRKIHKLWIVGSNSKIGKELIKQIDPRIVNVLHTDESDVDITKIDDALAFSYLNQPDAIINCYDFSNFTENQDNLNKAFRINALGARNLAICSRKIGARLVHLSTDLVFASDKNIEFNEFDTPNPKDSYSISKFEGERFVKGLAQKYFIIRTSYLYDNNLDLNDINKSYMNRNFSPTSTTELAKFIIMIMNTPEYGTYHASDLNSCTVSEFINEINKTKKVNYDIDVKADNIVNINLKQFMLEISNLYKFPSWKEDLYNIIK